MSRISREAYRSIVREARETHFGSPFDLAYQSFVSLGLCRKERDAFCEHASDIVEQLRAKCWEAYQPIEKSFTTKMLSQLIDAPKVMHLNPIEAIEDFVSEYPEHIYDLSLSNTQSRRSRAGKEFEAILALLFMGADIPVQTQGAVAKPQFSRFGIGKMVDFVSPSVVQYLTNKRNTILISAKTTLRERWQEVPEEVNRTGIREMYLATLDDSITQETLQILYEANVIIVTTRRHKHQCYNDNPHIMTFEELIGVMQDAVNRWRGHTFSPEEIETLGKYFERQIGKHSDHPYIEAYYQRRLVELRIMASDS